jgi:four helix bundle protein
MRNFKTYQLAKEFYTEAETLKFTRPAKDQYKRALLSICLNLAEGSGKPTAKDRARFYSIALGSLREVQALLDLYNFENEYNKADQLGAMIFRLIQNPGSVY